MNSKKTSIHIVRGKNEVYVFWLILMGAALGLKGRVTIRDTQVLFAPSSQKFSRHH